jgi:ketosteroid isomerase-like protein
MKRSLFAALIAVSLMPALPTRVVDSAVMARSAEDDIRVRIIAWDDALKERNALALSNLLADNFTMTDASGAVLTKAEYLQAVAKTPALRLVNSYASDDVVITVEGKIKTADGDAETASVTGRSEIKGRARGGAQMVAGVYRFTDRWIKMKGGWRAVSTIAVREP